MTLDQANSKGDHVLWCVSGTKTASLNAQCVLAHCPDEGANNFLTAVLISYKVLDLLCTAFIFGDQFSFQCIDCCFVRSYWKIKVSLNGHVF